MKRTVKHIDKCHKAINELKTSIDLETSNEGKFWGKAFIVFNLQTDAEKILQKFHQSI